MFDGIEKPNWGNLMPQQHTIMKRVEAQPKETTMQNGIDHDDLALINKAEFLIDQGRLDEAQAAVEQVEALAKAKHRVTTTHSYDTGDDNDQQLSDLQGAADEDPDDTEDDTDDTDDPDDTDGEGDDENDDEEDAPAVKKAYERFYGNQSDNAGRRDMYASSGQSVFPDTKNEGGPTTPKFLIRADRIRLRDGSSRNQAMRQAAKEHPQDFETFQRWQDKSNAVKKAANGGFDPLQPRGSTMVHPNRQSYSTAPAVPPPKRSPEWDDFVDQIVRERGCTRTVALQTARRERPDLYTRYQAWFSGTSAQNQQPTRSATDAAFKSAQPCYEDLVAAELKKMGAPNLVVAQQRVIQAYGSQIPKSAITKGLGVDLVDQLQQKIEDVCDETGCSLTEGQRWVGKAYPHLLKALR
jgi:hypothetical protein